MIDVPPMNTAQSALVEAVRSALSDKAVITAREDVAPWETDWRGRFHGHAPAILAPAACVAVVRFILTR